MRNALLLVLLVCASSAFSQQTVPATAPAEQVSVDSPRTTSGGATFTAPGGWMITTTKGMVVLQPPEPDTHIAIFESDAADAKGGVPAAWAAYKPQSHALRLVTPRPSRNGWEERQVFDYETCPHTRAGVQGIASRGGTCR